MAKLLQLRRGTTSQHSSFTGAVGEVTVDTDKDVVVVHDGSTAGGTALATEASVTAKQAADAELTELATMASGTASALADLTQAEVQILDGATVTTAELNTLDGVTSTAAELNLLDGVTSTTAELNILDGVTSTAAELNLLDGVTSTTAELNILDGVTSTTAELNILDGVTSTAAELNILDGVTSSTAELNLLDGVTSTTAELNILDGVTSTAAELNLVDGITAGTVSASKALIVDASKDLTGLNDVTIAGNLTVNGTTTTIDTTNLTVEDPLISLAKNNNSSNTVDIGFYGLYDATGSQDVYTGLFRDANDSGKWKLFELNQAAPTTTVDTSGTGYTAATLVVGTLEDSKGDVRKIPENAKTTNYTLVAADAGKHIKFTPGDANQTLTVPDSVFASGDAITIVNNSGNNLAIAKGTNMYYAADGTNANRTLAGRGVATLLFIAADTCYITGAGLS